MPPLDGITAFVLGTALDLPTGGLGRLRRYFTIGVNRIWKRAVTPTVSFWIDGDVYSENPARLDRTLCVCDRSVKARAEHVGLPTLAGELPARPDPRRLHHLPNTGAVAALWAVSLGCYPVVLLGMGARPDGRDARRLAAMRRALNDVLKMRYRPSWARWPTLWPWRPEDFEENMTHYSVTPCDAERVARTLREFYK